MKFTLQQSALAKRPVRKHIDRGNNVQCPEDLAAAVVSQGHHRNAIVLLGKIVDKAEMPKKKQMSKCSECHDFTFTKDGIEIKRFSGLEGNSRLFVPEPKNQTARFDACIIEPGDPTKGIPFTKTKVEDATPRQCVPQNHHPVSDSQDDDKETDSTGDAGGIGGASNQPRIYQCPEEFCVREFTRKRDLDEHMLFQNCKIKTKTTGSKTQIKTMYFNRLDDGNFATFMTKGGVIVTNMDKLEENEIPALIDPLPTPFKKDFSKGFGIIDKKPPTRIDPRVKNYIHTRYMEGAVAGHHALAYMVANDLQDEKNEDGSPKFDHTIYVTPQQVGSQFSTTSKKQKDKGITQMIQSGDEDGVPDENAELQGRREAVERIQNALEQDEATGHPFTVSGSATYVIFTIS